MSTLDERLARKGRGEPLGGLAKQSRVSHAHWKDHAAELAAGGFPEEDGQALGNAAAELESDAAKQAEGKGDIRDGTQREMAAVMAAKALVRKIRNVAPTAFRKRPVQGVDEDSFNAGGELGRSATKISAYLLKIAPAAAAAAESLRPYLGGQDAGALVKAARGELLAASVAQEVAIASLPVETQKLYETKGRALELIEDLNRVARNVFDGNAAVAGKFSKDVLLKARRPGPGGGGGGTP